MSRQIRFFANDDDYRGLLQLAESLGARAVPQIIEADSIAEAVPPTQFDPGERAFFYLIPAGVSPAEAFYKEMSIDPARAKLLPRESPAIEIGPNRNDGDTLHNSRIYLATDESDPNYESAKRLYKSLEKELQRWPRSQPYDIVIGLKTAKLAREGKVRLLHALQPVQVTD